MTIHRGGIRIILTVWAVCGLLIWLVLHYLSGCPFFAVPVIAILIFFMGFVLYFFRVPSRHTPEGENLVTAVADGEIDAGVLIHEGRFTYASQGLRLIADLGQEWERSALPIPLGGILLNRRYPAEVAAQVGRIIRRSIEYAQAHPEASAAYVKAHAQELDPEVRRKHITYFVNDYSLALGDEGRRAVERLTGLTAEQMF